MVDKRGAPCARMRRERIPFPPFSLNTPMLDFAHDDRFPRRAPQPAASAAGRLALNDSGLGSAPRSRADWVLAIKAQVAAGEYLTAAKLDGALETMLDQASV